MRGVSPVMCWWMATMLIPEARLQNTLQLALEHGEVAVHDGAVIAAGERRPGVHAHRVAHGVPADGARDPVTQACAAHLRLAADGDFVDAVGQLALAPEDRLDLRRVERGRCRIDVGVWKLALLHPCEYLSHRGGELRLIAHPADVHEHHAGLVPEKVVVEGGHDKDVRDRSRSRSPAHRAQGRADVRCAQRGNRSARNDRHRRRLACCLPSGDDGGGALLCPLGGRAGDEREGRGKDSVSHAISHIRSRPPAQRELWATRAVQRSVKSMKVSIALSPSAPGNPDDVSSVYGVRLNMLWYLR